MNNFEKIKTFNLDEMAKFITRLHCQECYYQDDWRECKQVGCWCHENNGYLAYKGMLAEEYQDE